MVDTPRWTELLDPSPDALRGQLPASAHSTVVDLLAAPLVPGDEPRSRIESHGDYVVGVLVVAVAIPDEDRVAYQEVDFVLTAETLLTVVKSADRSQVFDTTNALSADTRPDVAVGMLAFRLVDEIAEAYLDLIDTLNDEIDELEEHVEEWPAARVRGRISTLRHDLLWIRRHLSPLRDAVHKIVDGRVELDEQRVFTREIQLSFADSYDKLLRASEGLETSRELLASVRDYFQAKLAADQNEVVKRLTVVASLLLVPTFIVGVYGQNFDHMPELRWQDGYWFSWALIGVTTLAQLAFFRWRRWI